MKKGFTLVEMIIGLLICSILMLTIGMIGRASLGSYDRLTKEAEVYNEVYSAVSFIERYARRHQGQNVGWNNANQNFTGYFTEYVNGTPLSNLSREYNFSIVREPAGSNYNLKFYSITNIRNLTTNHIINTTYGNTTIMQNISSLNIYSPSLPSDTLLNFTLSGTKDNFNFNRSISVLRRNA